jgi:extracellular elastinolytic metalloproteinase
VLLNVSYRRTFFNFFNMLRLSVCRLVVALLLSLGAVAATAQQQNARETALNHLRAHASEFGLTAQDVSEVQVVREYTSKKLNVTHVWVQQMHLGVPVFNGLFGLHVTPNGRVVQTGHRFVPHLAEKINSTLPSLSAQRALELAATHLGILAQDIRLQEKKSERHWVFAGNDISEQPIEVAAAYATVNDGASVQLVWTMVIDPLEGADLWNIRVNAMTGQIVDKINHTTYCNFGHTHRLGERCEQATAPAVPAAEGSALNAVSTYRVYPLPAESPAHGSHELVTDPANTTASPQGWHDINGVAGAEFTYTRGNNVWAYDDLANDNSGSVAESVDGSAQLNFNQPVDPNAEPETNRKAAIINLFYMNNMMHDITYLYGFDEQAGNFQNNSYGRGGVAGDEVRAEALDSGGTDNANFSSPADGTPGRMQMYKWSRSGGNIVSVTAPSPVVGTYFGQAAGGWGGPITTTPVVGQVAIANDGTGDATLGCEPLQGSLSGKIVMVDRGICEFGRKALNVQNKGGVACIICNFANSTAGMAAGDFGGQVTIPVLMMAKNDCDLLRQFVNDGLTISLAQPVVPGPDFLDGDFDNGIIAHEYGHGISNRLTGVGAGCLGNEEQMGEGWSDFMTLVMTTKAGDMPDQNRGIGTYVTREPNNGTGIRRYPYNTNMTISPVTYATVAENTGVHAIGEVWAAMLWDLYWAMVDQYGFDADWTNTNSGNARALQLVMDGMKLQPCNPGFKDGFNAIMAADELAFNGADTCLISQVFARRGLGLTADQGTAASAADGVENFEPIPTCVKELKITKSTTTPTINPGDIITYKITVTNHKDEAVTNVLVSDQLPAGLTFIGSTNGGTSNGSSVNWDLGTMASGQVRVLTYTAQSGPTGSIGLYSDQMEVSDDWFPISNTGSAQFQLQNSIKVSGQSAWFCTEPAEVSDAFILKTTPFTVTGANPVLRFANRYDTESGKDAGFVEFQKDGESNWNRILKEKGFRGGYTGGVDYATIAIPFLNGFSGSSQGWTQSYFDIKQFDGQSIFWRYRFVSNATVGGGGWYIDDAEVFDMFNYDGEACVTSTQGDAACAKAPNRGVIVNPGAVSTTQLDEGTMGLSVQPNPAHDLMYVSVSQAVSDRAMLSLVGMDGRLVWQRNAGNLQPGQALAIDVAAVPAGIYLLRLDSAAGISVVKVAID